MKRTFDENAYCQRVRLVRQMLGDKTETETALLLGIHETNWLHYERGFPMSNATIELIAAKLPGVTAGWLLFGDKGSS